MNDIYKRKIDRYEVDQHFSNCLIPSTLTDGRLMAINDKFLAIPWIQNKQSHINIAYSNNPVNLASNLYGITKSPEFSNILDMEFSPFNSNILAYSTDINSVILSMIQEGQEKIYIKPSYYKQHSKKVSFVNFNPIASNVMCSCTTTGELHIWDTNSFQNFGRYAIKDPYTVSWSPNGDLIGISTKSRTFHFFDPRNSNMKGVELFSNQKFDWLDNNNIVSIGYDNKNNINRLSLLDLRNAKNFVSSISIEINLNKIFVDKELKLIYSVGKNDS